MSESRQNKNKAVASVVAIFVLAMICGVFLFLYVDIVGGFMTEHALLIKIAGAVILTALCVVAVIFYFLNNEFIVKLDLTTLVFAAIVIVGLYVLLVTGVSEKISSVEELREYIDGFGAYAVVATLIMQILQVVILPIPGLVAVGASVALFGPLKGGIISFVGIWIGSMIAFFIGRVLGYKAASWLVGKDALDKGLESVKGKDKVVLTCMFLFPFFPDDVLCFVAGLSSMSKRYFIIMMTITRLISVFTTAYMVEGSIIPYNTWWGILIWAVIIVGSGVIGYLVYKNGEKIEAWFKEKFSKKK